MSDPVTVYSVIVFQSDRADWLSDLREAINDELMAIGLHRSVEVVLTEDRHVDGPAVGVFLGDPGAANDPDLSLATSDALTEGLVVVPVVADIEDFTSQVVPELTLINAFEWSGVDPSRRLARHLFEFLGLEDSDRRVFISHKRSDGLGAAEHVHDALIKNGFRAFIDRFSVDPGDDIQATIADALEDYAFLLLLETPDAHISNWVFDEVDYALSHTMGVLIVEWPGNPTPVPGSPGVPRFVLTEDDLVRDDHGYDTLTDQAMDRLVAHTEARHADALVRRRRMLFASIQDAATASGSTSCVPVRQWNLRVSHSSGNTMIGITPRLPTAQDLQQLDEFRDDADPLANALLVHSARVLRSDLLNHLTWVAGDRDLTLVPENAIGGWW